MTVLTGWMLAERRQRSWFGFGFGFFVCLFACLFVCLFNDVFGDIIWILLYLDLCITKKLIIMELSDLKRSGYDVKLCLFFPQVSKQNELKL